MHNDHKRHNSTSTGCDKTDGCGFKQLYSSLIAAIKIIVNRQNGLKTFIVEQEALKHNNGCCSVIYAL